MVWFDRIAIIAIILRQPMMKIFHRPGLFGIKNINILSAREIKA